MTPFAKMTALLAGLALLLAACGDGGSSSGDPAVAGGGIGGTGKGTVTGYGSVILDGPREFEIAAGTDVRLDGAPTTEDALQLMGTGLVARVLVGDDANSDLTHGTALSLYADHLVIGPVTEAPAVLGKTFKVLGQTVVTSATTEAYPTTTYADIDALLAALNVDDVVAVSGYSSADNMLVAERVELNPEWATEWKLTGPASNVDLGASTLEIGAQPVNFGATSPADCDGDLADGDWVDIRATPNSLPFVDPLGTVTSLTCFDPGLLLPPGVTTGTIQASIEGLVDSDALQLSKFVWAFNLSGQGVVTDKKTVYHGGEPEDIVAGAYLEVQGKLDLAEGVITAKQVRFHQVRMRARGPVEPEAVVPGVKLTIMGIDVYGTPLTKDAAGLLSSPTSGQYWVYGYRDVDGTLYADRIEPQGKIDPDSVVLRGPVGTVNAPSRTFTILGVTIDTSGPKTLFFNLRGGVIPESEFLDLLVPESQAEAMQGTYTPATVTITAASKITLMD
jgi:hypothetical protein